MLRVDFLGADRSRDVTSGTTLLAAIRRAGLPIGRSCDGAGICRACVIHVLSGGELLTPPTDLERVAGADGEIRLACQARLLDPRVSNELGQDPHSTNARTTGAPTMDARLPRARSASLTLRIWSTHFGPLPEL